MIITSIINNYNNLHVQDIHVGTEPLWHVINVLLFLESSPVISEEPHEGETIAMSSLPRSAGTAIASDGMV